jgi:hypothetical protein
MSYISEQLTDSASDFLNIVWPEISIVPLIGGGALRSVEAVTDRGFAKELDFLAGIDAWQILTQPASSMRGIASRVQWGAAHDSFSIRTSSRYGQETEFQKRLHAVRNTEEGYIYPHFTVQAYLEARQGQLISAAAVRTKDLIEAAAFLMDKRDRLRHRPDFYGFIDNPDGSSFIYMKWPYLIYKGVLHDQDIRYPSA